MRKHGGSIVEHAGSIIVLQQVAKFRACSEDACLNRIKRSNCRGCEPKRLARLALHANSGWWWIRMIAWWDHRSVHAKASTFQSRESSELLNDPRYFRLLTGDGDAASAASASSFSSKALILRFSLSIRRLSMMWSRPVPGSCSPSMIASIPFKLRLMR